ncbi:DNA polymerase I [Candidatus Tokpelaia sp.]|uniref:DNA polymerase I n=1 Tax=Candidatus Tokpelaia sp. TaxID=2233777 RepID=UPI00123C7A6C|nr:DNA polymerase I [Candidatus Tokpelaia sp.]KAA6406325.1 DNA polymerase I [Candidatus Tokpelaia sp.]
MKQGDHVFLVDGSGYIFRSYHALPPLTRKSDGLPCGAVAGFCNMLWKLLREARDDSHKSLAVPTHFAVVFDHSAQTFRKEIYPAYKANRPPPPADLIPQFGLIRTATRAFNLPCIEKEGYEADDILATLARRAEAAGAEVTIISSDKDLMQLVGSHIGLYDPMKNKAIGRAEVIDKWGVPPEKMVDFQALVGDSTDNVPGVPGIGPKTAAELLQQSGSLAAVLAGAGEIAQKKRRETLTENADKALLSRKLVELCAAVPLEQDLDNLALVPPDRPACGARLIGFLKAMEFNSLTRRVAAELDMDAAAIDPAFIEVEWPGRAAAAVEKPPAGAFGAAAGEKAEAGAGKVAAALPPAVKIDRSAYKTLSRAEDLQQWLAQARDQGLLAFDTETSSLDPLTAELIGFSLALAPGKAAYVPLGHYAPGGGEADLLGDRALLPGQMPKAQALALLKPVLEDESVLKIGQNIKYDMQIMAGLGIGLRSFDDTMLLSYVLQAGAVNSHGLDALAEQWLNHRNLTYAELMAEVRGGARAGFGRSAPSFAEVGLARATEYAAEDADVTLRLWQALKPFLLTPDAVFAGGRPGFAAPQSRRGLSRVYERLERPLVPVLAAMERRGVLVDNAILAQLSAEFAAQAEVMAQEIYALAGEEFNIGSPKQLGEILFGKFALPEGRKTKTGQWSTSAQVLEDLAAQGQAAAAAGGALGQGYALAGKIVAWRQVKKLQSTYTDALPNFQDAQGRVHTNYALAATTTGRLSSSEPNLQNIPVRSREGRQIRTAFIAPPGKLLLSADYSQIELRLLAHVADIGALKAAFADGADIHAMTAAEMFNVPLSEMTAEIRRRAKAINFGIIYGISAFGLANQLGIGRKEADDYIKTYFARFPGIRDYMEETKAFARAHGYVETIFGRRVHYPQITASNPALRAFNERAAINAPLQGAAADIIRRAMIRMEDGLAQAGLAHDGGAGDAGAGDKAQMLLQVHDELIFEVEEDAVEQTIAVVREIMENAAFPAVNLSVPLKVDARAAKNWNDAH